MNERMCACGKRGDYEFNGTKVKVKIDYIADGDGGTQIMGSGWWVGFAANTGIHVPIIESLPINASYCPWCGGKLIAPTGTHDEI